MGWEYMLIDAGWQKHGQRWHYGRCRDITAEGSSVWLWYHSAGREKILYRHIV